MRIVEAEILLSSDLDQDEADILFSDCAVVSVSGRVLFLRGSDEAVNSCITLAATEGLK